VRSAPPRALGAAVAAVLAVLLAGCGLKVAPADLFVLTRTGQGQKLTMLLSDGGTIRCNGGKVKPISDQLLLQARDVAQTLDDDLKLKLKIPPAGRNSVFSYTVQLQDGTIRFPDTAASSNQDLAHAEQFVLAVAPSCGLSA
jgi:hypothetical protein